MHAYNPVRTAESPLSWCGTDRDLFKRGEQVIRPGRMSMPMVVVSGALRLDLPARTRAPSPWPCPAICWASRCCWASCPAVEAWP